MSPGNHDSPCLDEIRAQKIETWTKTLPQRFRVVYRAGITGKSRKAAVRSMCLECVGFDTAEVARCTDYRCPLWAFRERG